MFSLLFSNQAEKFLDKCDKSLRNRILEKIKLLTTEPVPHNSVRVQGEDNSFRIRIGDYRVLYDVYWTDGKIFIAKVDKRSRVYD